MHRQNTPPRLTAQVPVMVLEPTPEDVSRLINTAAEHIHYAICRTVGSSQSWQEATAAHKQALKRQVFAIVEGRLTELVAGEEQ